LRWGLEAFNQDQRALVGEVQNSFQGRKDADEQAAEPVDATGSVGGQIGAVGGQQPQPHNVIVKQPQLAQIASHPGLVGDDRGVPCIRLALTPVASRCPVDCNPWKVEHRLSAVQQQRNHQRARTVSKVNRPRQVRDTVANHIDERGQLQLVVDHPP
jgi:hypothetical protein